jgi:hypothetical protein
MLKKIVVVLLFSLALVTHAFAQSNELGIVIGSTFSPDNTLSPITFQLCPINNLNCGDVRSHSGLTFEGVFAHRIFNAHIGGAYLEFPLVGTTDRSVTRGNLVQDFSSIFFTPSLKLKLNVPVVSPFVSVGGGFAHFSPGSSPLGPPTTSSSSQGAFQAGGGLDLTTPVPHLALRGEIREFFTGKPDFTPSRHNLLVGGGLVLRF